MAESGLDGRGEWQPAFEGQRPPFPVKHGAYSLQLVSDDAAQLLERLRSSDAPWLADVDAVALESWAFAVAQCRRLREAVGSSSKADDQLRAWDRRLAHWTSVLGFDPLSRERLTRDAAVARAISARSLESLQERGSAHVDRALGDGA